MHRLPSQLPLIEERTGGHLVIEACLDVSSSYYPSPAFDQAKASVANAIDGLVVSNSDGATIYVGLITANSFDTGSAVSVITIPPLPADPNKPVLKPIAPTDDPYQRALLEKKAQDDYHSSLLAWQAVRVFQSTSTVFSYA